MSKRAKNQIRDDLMHMECKLQIGIKEHELDEHTVQLMFQSYSELFFRYKQVADEYSNRMRVWNEVDPLIQVDLERADIVEHYQTAQAAVTVYLRQLHQEEVEYKIEMLQSPYTRDADSHERSTVDTSKKGMSLVGTQRVRHSSDDSITQVKQSIHKEMLPKRDLKAEIDQVVEDLERTYMEARERQAEIYTRLSLAPPPSKVTSQGHQSYVQRELSQLEDIHGRQSAPSHYMGHPTHQSTPKDGDIDQHDVEEQSTRFYTVNREEADHDSHYSEGEISEELEARAQLGQRHERVLEGHTRQERQSVMPERKPPDRRDAPERDRMTHQRPDHTQGLHVDNERVYPTRLQSRQQARGITMSPDRREDGRRTSARDVSPRGDGVGRRYPPPTPLYTSEPPRYPRTAYDNESHLERLSVPIFKGDEKRFATFWGAFDRMVDSRPDVPADMKLIRLERALQDDAVWVLDGLGCDAAYYAIAKSRLFRKYGGEKRQINTRLAELRKLKPVREDNYHDMERLADMLEAMVAVMASGGSVADLSSSTLYGLIKEKLPAPAIVRYNRWINEHGLEKNVETIKIYISEEASYLMDAQESLGHPAPPSTKTGGARSRQRERRPGRESGRSLHAQEKPAEPPKTDTASKARRCRLCSGPHWIYLCEKFKQMSVMDRWTKVSQMFLCFKCLGSGHRVAECRWGKVCGAAGCTQRHHRLLHRDEIPAAGTAKLPEPGEKPKPPAAAPRKSKEHRKATAAAAAEMSDASLVIQTPRGRNVALRTIPVVVRAGDKCLPINALLDDGSTRTYVNQRVADFLGISGPVQDASVGLLAGTKTQFQGQLVVMNLRAMDGSDAGWLKALTMERVLGPIMVPDWQELASQWEHLEDIQFPKLNMTSCIDLLIGSDASTLHNSIIDIAGAPGAPVARLTPLGWTCVGSTVPLTQAELDRQEEHSLHACSILQEDADGMIAQSIAKYWEMEEPPPAQAMKPEERQAQAIVSDTCVRVNGRFTVGVPWKRSGIELPNNYAVARKRLEHTERKLSRNDVTRDLYCATLQGYVDKGYIQEVHADPRKELGQWLVPHFGVIKMDRASTKCRVVFDAPAQYKGVSLSDMVLTTPSLLNDLVAVLTRFRRYPICIGGDITEMYLQVELRPDDRKLHRFLWRNMKVDEEPRLYEHLRAMFGNPASPYMVGYVVLENAKEHVEECPRAAESIADSTYMDDTLDSVSTVPECVTLYRDLNKVWAAAGMKARKWMSNSTEVLATIPPEDRAKGIELQGEALPTTKTLGVSWRAEDDSFTFAVDRRPPPDVWTKRLLLRRVATLFDPLGLVAPVVVAARIILQQVWQSGADWDEQVEPRIQARANQWLEELPAIEEFCVPRALQLHAEVKDTQLHLFSDASSEAYGAVCYVRHEYPSGEVSVRLCLARCKVAPLKPVSIPRLELTAAVLAVRVMEKIAPVLQLSKSQCYLWTDSTDVLYWIHGMGRCYKPYISNRIGLIQVATDPDRWRHVPTKQNPADHASRGLTGAEMMNDRLWLQGPKFLSQNKDQWPVNKVGTQPADPERRALEQTATASTTKRWSVNHVNLEDSRLAPARYSSWLRLRRCMAMVLRFVQNVSSSAAKKSRAALTADDIHNAEIVQLVAAQTVAYAGERRRLLSGATVTAASKLAGLRPWLDNDGLMRVDGRLKQAAKLSWETKNPVILPRIGEVTRLVVKDYHEQCGHGGTNQTLAALSTKYWITGAREAIIAWSRRCAVCRLHKARPASQLMAPLPEIRSRMTMRPFETLSVDYAGPLYTKQGRGRAQGKRYFCLFACLSTRAVHLEMSYAMDTDAFLNAFSRMVARRGLPREVWSDNGTNFVSGERELRELLQAVDKTRVQEAAANRGILWHFNPPGASHFNGVHEILVKAAKRALLGVLGGAGVTDEELMTALTQAEDLLNSRPLTYQSADVKDAGPLTPNHFLHGRCGGYFAPTSVDDEDYNIRKRWRVIQELTNSFWTRWMREWLPSLHPRTKWARLQRNIKVGDIVLLISAETARGRWPLGRIEGTFPGADGIVRAVDVRVGTQLYRCPIVKVCPLELDTIK